MITAGIAPHEVTVVVPTRNETANIRRFLASLPPELSVVVVDSSDDDTAAAVARHRPDRTLIIRARVNIATARQLGALAAETRWVLFTDADVMFHPAYFARLAEVILDPAAAGIVGAKGTVDGYDGYHRWFLRGQGALMALGIPAATGSNMLVRRDVLERLGGFDPELSVNEDSELMFRVQRQGHLVVFRPDLTVLSFDHRRLDAGVFRKVAHGAVRNTALYLGLFPRHMRRNDWGYWKVADAPAPGP